MSEPGTPPSTGVQTSRVGDDDAGQRLDVYLASHLGESRTRAQSWIRGGRVAVDGRTVRRCSLPLSAGAELSWRPPPRREEPELRPEPGELRILFEDPYLVVLDKPAGLAVHPGAGRSAGTLAHRLLHRYPDMAAVGHPRRPGIVHRLDLGTTGALIVARRQDAYQALSRAFARREVDKTYLGICYGCPRPRQGAIEASIRRDPRNRKRMAAGLAGGRPALTLYETLACEAKLAFLALDLRTGRTHQIRVHLKSIRHPLVGDDTYGEARWKGFPTRLRRQLADFPRPALHAYRLAFDHPVTRARLSVTAPLPVDMDALWRGCTGTEPPLPGSD